LRAQRHKLPSDKPYTAKHALGARVMVNKKERGSAMHYTTKETIKELIGGSLFIIFMFVLIWVLFTL